MTAIGKVALLGAGPGDPELITLRARRRLQEADIVLYDALIHPDLLQWARPDAERVFVGKRAGRASARQEAINQQMLEAARAGKRVARLKGGDPFLFGRGSEEAEFLAAHGIPYEVVPGVPSPSAATAYAGISLSHRDLASSISYLTATESVEKDSSSHDWSKLATATQTLVIFMGVRRLESLMNRLIEHGRPASCPAAVIQSASLPSQRTVVGTVGTIAQLATEADIGMPALTVVGEVVRLRERLRWYDLLPLFGKRVLVTRPLGQAQALEQALRDAGAEPVSVPAIAIDAPVDPSALKLAVERVADYDWVVFTSANGVDRFFAELSAQGADARRLGGTRIAAIGSATGQRLHAHGLVADCIPEEYRGEAVAAAMIALQGDMKGCRVLLPRAAVAREALPELLRDAGAQVDVVDAYRARAPRTEEAARLKAALEEVDVVTFTSTSTLTNTLEALGAGAVERLAARTVASIGPVTSDAARARGVRVDVTAEVYTVEGLVEALQRHFTVVQ